MKYILYAFLVYVAYQFIFNLLIPVIKASRKIKKGFREMHERMNQPGNQAGAYPGAQPKQTPAPEQKDRAGDYIEFEEIK